MSQNVETKPLKRGAFLWIMLANSTLLSFTRLMTLLFPTFFANVYAGGPSWFYAFNAFIFVVEVFGITGLFIWRRWGAYLIVTITLIGILEDFLYLSSRKADADILLTTVVLALFIWAVTRKWSYFR